MGFTVFLGNLPTWVAAEDIESWLASENLAADSIKVIRDHQTQESKGFAFVEAPNADEMQAIIRRFDRAPLEDRLLRANPAQPLDPKGWASFVKTETWSGVAAAGSSVPDVNLLVFEHGCGNSISIPSQATAPLPARTGTGRPAG
jgi:RNA recognition motif-containing protein